MRPERAADRKEPGVFRAAAAFVLSELKLGTTNLLTIVVSLNGFGNCKLTDRVSAQRSLSLSPRRLLRTLRRAAPGRRLCS